MKNYERVIVVGDIHGCFDELQALLDKCEFSKRDLLVSVGDILDRGPNSFEVYNFFRNTNNALCVKGNHERKVLRSLQNIRTTLTWSQQMTISQFPKEKIDELKDWLLFLPITIETEYCIVVHARLNPGWRIDCQDERFALGVMGGEDADGFSVSAQGIPVWYENHGRLTKPIVVGHVSYPDVCYDDGHLFCLDTGVAKGGKLSAVIFPQKKMMHVYAKSENGQSINYHRKSLEKWRALRLKNLIIDRGIESYTYEDCLDIMSKLKHELAANEIEIINEQIKRIINDSLSVEGMDEFRVLLGNKYGKLPPPGVGRGVFIKSLRRSFVDDNYGRLAVALYNNKLLTSEDIVKSAVKNIPLNDLKSFFVLFKTAIVDATCRVASDRSIF